MLESKRPLKVFLCHAHADRDSVRVLYSHLIKDGVDAWFDKAKLLPGQDWELEIRKAVREADVVVVCLSKQFNQAGFRQKEVRLALDTAIEQPEGEIFLIPARLEECDTLDSLKKWNWVDLFEENGYEMLTRALQSRADKIGATLQMKRSRLRAKKEITFDDKKPVPVEQASYVETSKPDFEKTEQKVSRKVWIPIAIAAVLIGFVCVTCVLLISIKVVSNIWPKAPISTFNVTFIPTNTLMPTQERKPVFIKTATPSKTLSPTSTFIPTQLPTDTIAPLTSTSVFQLQVPNNPPTWTFQPSPSEEPLLPTITPSLTLNPTDIPTVSNPTVFKDASYSGSQLGCTFVFYVTVQDIDGVVDVTLYWKNGSTGSYESKLMSCFTPTYNGWSSWSSGEITLTGYPDPGNKVDDLYYFVATDTFNTSTSSVGSPHSFVGGCP